LTKTCHKRSWGRKEVRRGEIRETTSKKKKIPASNEKTEGDEGIAGNYLWDARGTWK